MPIYTKENANWKALQDSGYAPEVASQRDGWARLYLRPASDPTKWNRLHDYIDFRDNKQNAAKLMIKAQHSPVGTHIDIAMGKALEIVKQQ